MEVFLLLLDEIDDALAVARSLWPRMVGLMLAVMLLLATGFAVILHPRATAGVALFLIAAGLLEHVRKRRFLPVRN